MKATTGPPSGSTDHFQSNGGNISVSTNVFTPEEQQQQPTAEVAQLGDEYISLTFNESESSEEDSDDDGDDDDEDSEEGSNPNEDQQDVHLYSS